MSWQQALQDKGCKSKSQGTKEETFLKRQAPGPRRDREAPEAGGTMNVEKTGKGGPPTDLDQPWLKPEGRLLWHLSCPHTLSSSSGDGPAKPWLVDTELRDPSLPFPAPGTPSSRCHQRPYW